MQFLLGFIVGILGSTLVFAILAFFRAGIEKRVRIVETKLAQAGPKPKGTIIMPMDEADILRQEKIESNRKAGKDTPISDLQ